MNLPNKKIIRLEPTDLLFTINWMLGLRCNFDCMYCPPNYHNTTDKDLTLIELQNHWKTIIEKTKHTGLKFRLQFTGGEVTINKDFLPFLHWLNNNYKDQIVECGFTTNGSANKKYYLEAISIDMITFITFSTHSEFFNEKKFFNTVVEVNKKSKQLMLKKRSDKKTVMVNIMDEYWNADNVKIYEDFLLRKGINKFTLKIDYSMQTRNTIKFNTNKQKYNFANVIENENVWVDSSKVNIDLINNKLKSNPTKFNS